MLILIDTGEELQLTVASNSRINKCDLNDFYCGMVVGGKRASLSISETAHLLGLLYRTVFIVYT